MQTVILEAQEEEEERRRTIRGPEVDPLVGTPDDDERPGDPSGVL